MREQIKLMDDFQLETFIRSRLDYSDDESFVEKRRFEFSGYGENNSCFLHNTDIINLFRDCGIYDYLTYLVIDAYKGFITLYYRWWNEEKTQTLEMDNIGTVEIIKEMLYLLYINVKDRPLRRF